MTLKERIVEVINYYAAENGSNTPDFILGEYLIDCLAAFDKATNARASWYIESIKTILNETIEAK